MTRYIAWCRYSWSRPWSRPSVAHELRWAQILHDVNHLSALSALRRELTGASRSCVVWGREASVGYILPLHTHVCLTRLWALHHTRLPCTRRSLSRRRWRSPSVHSRGGGAHIARHGLLRVDGRGWR